MMEQLDVPGDEDAAPADEVAPAQTGAEKEAQTSGADAEPDGTGDEALDEEEATVSQAEFAAQTAQLEARTEQLQRLQAEFHNYRRRMGEEQRLWEQRAVGRVLTELLPVLDNLERAAAADDSGSAEDIRQGVTLILRQLNEMLAGQGVERISAVGQPFDPEIHEAMMQTETDEVPDQHVLAEIQAGYRQGQTVLRPALVQVARNSPAAADAEQKGSGTPEAEDADGAETTVEAGE